MSKRGFAGLTPERLREIASMGGKAVPAEKRTFSRDRTLAMRAGQLGGKAVSAEKRSFSQDRVLASEAGRLGGQAVVTPRSFERDPELARRAGRIGHRMKRIARTVGE